jgi:hypothetical protein
MASTEVDCTKLFLTAAGTKSVELFAPAIWVLLNAPEINGKEIVDFLSLDPVLKTLFDSSAGVSQGYTIREHTHMVFDVFAKQFPLYKAHYGFQSSSELRLFQTLKFAIALHDIGKPIAIDKGDKDRQHEFTLPLVEQALKHFEFTDREYKLVRALVAHDFLGDYLKGKINARTTAGYLERLAEAAGMTAKEFVPLQFLFYIIDAGSYPSLREAVLTEAPDGSLTPKNTRFEDIWILIKD